MKKSLSFLSFTAFAALTFACAGEAKAFDMRPGADASGYVLIKDKASDSQDPIAKGAQDFINSMGQKATGFLGAEDLSESQKESEFRKLLKTSFDMQTIGRFALGRYWNTASEEERKEYLNLFESMIVDVYSQRFNEYDGQQLDVRSSRDEGKGDIVVQSYIIDDSNSEFRVDWRVRHKNGQYKIVDVVIEGVSMAVTQRSDFSSVIQRGGGSIDVLLNHLKS